MNDTPEYALVMTVLLQAVEDAVSPVTPPRSAEEAKRRRKNSSAACTYDDKSRALRWLERGDLGMLTAEQCCSYVGIDREIVVRHVQGRPAAIYRELKHKHLHERVSAA